MLKQTCSYRLFGGIDVSARTFTLASLCNGESPARARTLDQTPSGFDELKRQLLELEPDPAAILVVMEATTPYWMHLALALCDAHIAVAVINPAQAHDFAKALLKRSKTDATPAQTLAELAARLQPQPWTPPPPISNELQQCLVHRDALVDARTQFRNQLHAPHRQPIIVERVQTRLQELIATLSEQIAEVEQEISAALEQDAAWAEAAAYLASIKGLGMVTIAWLLTATCNFKQTATPEAAANYAGLVPQLRESGSSVRGRPRIGHSGHARLREALYMATLSAIQHNPLIRAFYQRLIGKGKAKKVAICAAARKLLRIAWAVATKKQSFDADYLEHQAARAV
jgi:transposase